MRPGTQYGRPEAPADDFGASNGYLGANSAAPPPDGSVHGSAPGPRVYGAAAPGGTYGGGNTYGSPAPGDDYSPGAVQYGTARSDAYDAEQDESYGPVPDGSYDAGYADAGYADESALYGGYRSTGTGYPSDGYRTTGPAGSVREPGNVTGDPHYRARRHRPSANDTNVGTFADFAGYSADEGYAPPPGRY